MPHVSFLTHVKDVTNIKGHLPFYHLVLESQAHPYHLDPKMITV